MDDNKGVAVVLVYSNRGMLLFDRIRDSIKIADADIEIASESNSCIVEAMRYNRKREEVFERLNKGEVFITSVNDLTKTPLIRKVKNKMVKHVRNSFLGDVNSAPILPHANKVMGVAA